MLNKAQNEVVQSNAEKLLVLAGAGTGKTTTMLARISRLVDENKVDVQSILVLTFTNAAACEMRDRYRRSHQNQQTPTFCTFHSFCYSLIAGNRDVARRLGYFKGTPFVADETTLHKVKTMCRQKCGTKISDDKLNGKTPVTKSEQFQKDLYWKQYNKLLRAQNLITFDIMCYEVCKLFVSDDMTITATKDQFKYVFVDEFQDTDPKQWDFVSSFTNANLFVCGDAKQAIYRFRGADSSIIKSLAESTEWTTIKLSENYRSSAQICDYSNDIHKAWKGSAYNLDIISTKHGSDVIEREELDSQSNQEIMNMVSDASNGKTVVILCRTNYEVADIRQRLESLDIAFCTKNERKDVSYILKSAIDPEFLVDWLSDKLTSSRYNEYLKLCAIDEKHKTEESFFSMYGKYLTEYLTPIMQIREILANEQFAYSKITQISDVLNLPNREVNLKSDDDKSIIEYLCGVAESVTNSSNIYIGTIHSVKGLEYDCVHLLGVNGKSFPIGKDEDQQNLFYVGCTRAKEKLVIYDSDWSDTSDIPTDEEIKMEISDAEKYSEKLIKMVVEDM